MAEQNLQNEDGELQPSPGLAEALRRLQKPVILVPPQVDAAALTRPRLHLARVRQLSGGSSENASADREDLALAARTGEQTVRPSQFASRGVLAPMARLKPKNRWQFNLFPWIAILALLAAVLLALSWWTKTTEQRRGIVPAVRQPTPP